MLIILDTDHLSLYQRYESIESIRLHRRFSSLNEGELTTSIITFEEQMRGWLAVLAKSRTIDEQVLAYSRLSRFVEQYRRISVLDFDEKAADVFRQLKNLKLKVASMDLKIASIAIANDALLLSRNLKDFESIPNLRVEDWTIEQANENQ